MNSFADDLFWNDVSGEHDHQQRQAALVHAKVAVAPYWAFLSSATSERDFDNRLSLSLSRISSLVAPETLDEVLSSLRDDYRAVTAGAKSSQDDKDVKKNSDDAKDQAEDETGTDSEPDKDNNEDPEDDDTDNLGKTGPAADSTDKDNDKKNTKGTSKNLDKDKANDDSDTTGKGGWDSKNKTWTRETTGGIVPNPTEWRGPGGRVISDENMGNNMLSGRAHVLDDDQERAHVEGVGEYRAHPPIHERMGAFVPDPSDKDRYYAPYADLESLPLNNGDLQGPDGFVADLAEGEQRTPEAYARQTTPGTWTEGPGMPERPMPQGVARGYQPVAAYNPPPENDDTYGSAYPHHRREYDLGYHRGFYSSPHPDDSDRPIPLRENKLTSEYNLGYFHGQDSRSDHLNKHKDFPKESSLRFDKEGFLIESVLVPGHQLSPDQRKMVLSAFPHRWTHENPYAGQVYGDNPPTIDKVSDSEWLATHAFHLNQKGELHGNHRYAEPYYGDHRESSRKQSVVDPVPGAPLTGNPFYFDQGRSGLTGEGFPEDPGPEPLADRANDYGTVGPVSTGSEEGQVDGNGYSRSQPGRQASVESPNFNATSASHFNHGFYDAKNGRLYAGEEHQDTEEAQTYRQGWDEWHNNYGHAAADRQTQQTLFGHVGSTNEPHKVTETAWGPYCSGNSTEKGCGFVGSGHDVNPKKRDKTASTDGRIVDHCPGCDKPRRVHSTAHGDEYRHIHNDHVRCFGNPKNAAQMGGEPTFKPGDRVISFRGEGATVHRVYPSGQPGKSNRVQVRWDDPERNLTWDGKEHPEGAGDQQAYYENVFKHHPDTVNHIGDMIDSAVPHSDQITKAYGSIGWGHDTANHGTSWSFQDALKFNGENYTTHFDKEGFITEAGDYLGRPDANNPTGRGADEFRARTWDAYPKTRPMQSADDRNVNTPVLPAERLRTRDISPGNPQFGDTDRLEQSGEEDED